MKPRDMAKLTESLKMKARFEVCALEKRELAFDSPQKLRDRLRDLVQEAPDAQGWLCFQSQVLHFEQGEALPDGGTVRYAEIALDRGSTLVVRPGGGRGWRLIQLTEDAGEAFLAETVKHIGRGVAPDRNPGPGDLLYRRYWAPGADGYRAVAARFVGFREKDGGSP